MTESLMTKKGDFKNAGNSHDVIENKWREKLHFGYSCDVYEKKTT
jgi:hypothetical protein